MFNNIGITEILIVAGIIIVFFGVSKLPKFAKSLGQTGREIKNASRDLKEALKENTVA